MCSHPFFVLPSSICSQSLDHLSSLLFHFRLVLPELLQHVCRGFLLERIDVGHPGEIVGKEEIVIRSAITCWIDRTTQVAVDEFEWLCGPGCRLVRWLPVLLSFQTCLAYSHCRPGFYTHSIHHSCQLPDVVLAEMAHSSMPDVDI